MQRTSCRLPILSGCAAAFLLVCRLPISTTVAQGPQGAFDVSFIPGSRDDTGRFIGGTEMRVLAAHAGRLYAGNGYWEDRPGPEGLQGRRSSFSTDQAHAGGSIAASMSGCRMVARAIWRSRSSKKRPSQPMATAGD